MLKLFNSILMLYPKASKKNLRILVYSSALSFVGLIFFLTPYMLFATCSYFCMCIGLLFRKKNKTLHARLMITAIVMDLGLVFVLESQRHAINTAMNFSLGWLEQLHILFSTIATLLYFPVLFLGYKLLRAPTASQKTRFWHSIIGLTAFICRSLGFILMFSLLRRIPNT